MHARLLRLRLFRRSGPSAALAAALVLALAAPCRAQGGVGFEPGDPVALEVEGEPTLTGTFTVVQGPALALPGIGEVSLAGVPRAEVQAHLRAELGRYLRDPVVRARALVRIAVTGQVRTPGFFTLPGESLLSDAIMAAGGPLPTAKLAEARVDRGGARVWEGREVRDALSRGLTLDQMGLRPGDELHVPLDGGSRAAGVMRAATMIPTAVLAVVGLIRVF